MGIGQQRLRRRHDKRVRANGVGSIVSVASHVPTLLRVLRQLRPASILEVGAGWYSTPLLQAYSLAGDVEHCVLETNTEYRKVVSELYGCPVEAFDGFTLPSAQEKHWDLVFIDHMKDGRRKMAIAVKDCASAILLHDSQRKMNRHYKYSRIIPKWKYHRHFTEVYPHTLLLTDSDEVWKVLGA